MKKSDALGNSIISLKCHLCGNPTLEVIPGYEMFSQITSDCRPWPKGAKLCVCKYCGCVQKGVDDKWQSEVGEIYKGYAIYHQSNGIEQAVFDNKSGVSSLRSKRLLECLKTKVNLPKTGEILDVGCGNGALLRVFSVLMPGWTLSGSEVDDKYHIEVEGIAYGAKLYTCPLEDIAGNFDLITMLHVLEHIIDPINILKTLYNKLLNGGLLFVNCPNYEENPFDWFITDHCTHFSTQTLSKVLLQAGFEIIEIATDWVPKEISIIARKKTKNNGCLKNERLQKYDILYESVLKHIKWIDDFRLKGKEISNLGNFGIFGTSIAGTWLFNEIGKSVSFFVDEDPHRVSKKYMNLPVYHPKDVPKGSNVFIALPFNIAKSIFQRLSKEGIKYYLPNKF